MGPAILSDLREAVLKKDEAFDKALREAYEYTAEATAILVFREAVVDFLISQTSPDLVQEYGFERSVIATYVKYVKIMEASA